MRRGGRGVVGDSHARANPSRGRRPAPSHPAPPHPHPPRPPPPALGPKNALLLLAPGPAQRRELALPAPALARFPTVELRLGRDGGEAAGPTAEELALDGDLEGMVDGAFFEQDY